MRTPHEAELRRLTRVKNTQHFVPPMIGGEMVDFFKRNIQKRQAKFATIGECWAKAVPETFCEHTSLESFTKGTLTVLVDSASHLYELKQLLLAGVERQMLVACRGAGLRKIMLKRGRWYDGDGAERKIRF